MRVMGSDCLMLVQVLFQVQGKGLKVLVERSLILAKLSLVGFKEERFHDKKYI